MPPLAALGLILSSLAREASNMTPGANEVLPETDERNGVITGGDAPSDAEISSSEGMIYASEVGLMTEKICPRGSDLGGMMPGYARGMILLFVWPLR